MCVCVCGVTHVFCVSSAATPPRHPAPDHGLLLRCALGGGAGQHVQGCFLVCMCKVVLLRSFCKLSLFLCFGLVGLFDQCRVQAQKRRLAKERRNTATLQREWGTATHKPVRFHCATRTETVQALSHDALDNRVWRAHVMSQRNLDAKVSYCFRERLWGGGGRRRRVRGKHQAKERWWNAELVLSMQKRREERTGGSEGGSASPHPVSSFFSVDVSGGDSSLLPFHTALSMRK